MTKIQKRIADLMIRLDPTNGPKRALLSTCPLEAIAQELSERKEKAQKH